MTKAKFDQCLADQGAFQRLQAAAQAGQEQFNISATPTFIINGTRADGVFNWATLEPKIMEALK